MYRLSIISILVLVFSALVVSDHSFSQGNPNAVNSLKGLKDSGIGVGIVGVEDDAVADGLGKNKLLKMITDKLKKSGIKVLSDLELSTVKGQPKLVVSINTVKQPGPIYIFTTALDLNQIVVLERNPGLTAVSPTWTVLTTGGALPEELHANVEASVSPLLDSFISDYKKAKP